MKDKSWLKNYFWILQALKRPAIILHLRHKIRILFLKRQASEPWRFCVLPLEHKIKLAALFSSLLKKSQENWVKLNWTNWGNTCAHTQTRTVFWSVKHLRSAILIIDSSFLWFYNSSRRCWHAPQFEDEWAPGHDTSRWRSAPVAPCLWLIYFSQGWGKVHCRSSWVAERLDGASYVCGLVWSCASDVKLRQPFGEPLTHHWGRGKANHLHIGV